MKADEKIDQTDARTRPDRHTDQTRQTHGPDQTDTRTRPDRHTDGHNISVGNCNLPIDSFCLLSVTRLVGRLVVRSVGWSVGWSVIIS